MSDESQPTINHEFFIHELQRMDEESERRFQALNRRLTEVEGKNRLQKADPTSMLGGIFIVMVGLQLLPLVLDIIKSWKSSSSLPLSA